MGAVVGEVYGMGEKAKEISTNPGLMLLAIVLGIITSVAAAFIPARNGARVVPVQALQKGKLQQLSAGENRVRRISALAVATLGATCLFLRQFHVLLYLGDALTVLAALLLTPNLGQLVVQTLRPPLRWVRP